MKIRILLVVLIFLLFSTARLVAKPGDGKNIFTTRCMACHKIDKDFTGPALANVDKRHNIDWIIKFVHSSQSIIKSGDTSSTALFAKFNKTIMPDHPDLSEDNIKSIVEYVKEESAKIASAPKIPFEKPHEVQPNYSPVGNSNVGFIISYIIVIITLVLVLLFAVYVKQLERRIHG